MFRAVAAAAIVAMTLSGCVTTTFRTAPELSRATSDIRVLLMPLDVELSLVTAGGVPEPNAEWTARAEKHLVASIAKVLADRRAHVVDYRVPAEIHDPVHPHVQLVKLHGAVGQSIMIHKIGSHFRLPNKGETFDWSLGPGVKRLRQDFGADYAMFVFMRDSYTSGGRAVAMVLAAALFGVALQGGKQVGFASLVDLETGEIVWFNALSRGEGDLREPGGAEETVSRLLHDLPK